MINLLLITLQLISLVHIVHRSGLCFCYLAGVLAQEWIIKYELEDMIDLFLKSRHFKNN